MSAWDHGYKVGPKKALKAKRAWAIRFELSHRCDLHERALFDLVIDSKLRGCDVVKLGSATSSLAGGSAVGPP